MITPRVTRLVRVPDPRAMHEALARIAASLDPLDARRCAILVPGTSAAEALRRTLERHLLERAGRQVAVLPQLLTREELYSRWSTDLGVAPLLLSGFEREVLFRRAAREAAAEGASPPFSVRPALVPEMLAFYDGLRRRNRSVEDFTRLMTEGLSPAAGYDRGAERLLQQTRFLGAAFARFESLVATSGRLDEHAIRRRLLQSTGTSEFRRMVLTIADQTAERTGLWAADYDVLARKAGIERIEVVATEAMLSTGYLERIHDVFPGIEEERSGTPSSLPVLEVPEPDAAAAPAAWFACRDREEELAQVARHVKSSGVSARFAVVFQRPLPYVYLARSVLGDAAIPYQTFDELPLAAEPFAGALDLVFTCVTTEATRAALVELLGSPHFRFADDNGHVLARADVAALDDWLRDQKYLGGWDAAGRLDASSDLSHGARRSRSGPGHLKAALAVAARVVAGLRSVQGQPKASAQIGSVLAFVRAHERQAGDDARQQRARAAILAALGSLADAYARHDDDPLDIGELAAGVRRWMEAQTFSPRTGWSGLLLLDAAAAPYADVDECRLVGLVDGEWPDRSGRNIFYPAALLSQLGWAPEVDRQRAARARFADLLALPHRRLSASTFTLEGDAIVTPAALLEELESARHPRQRRVAALEPRVFVHEALSEDPVERSAVDGEAAAWLDLRLGRSAPDGPEFHGRTGARPSAEYAVSHVERYLECPFKYFAAYVLKLDEEREDESGLTPIERGRILHDVFERFFAAWRDSGRERLTVQNVGEALSLFAEVADDRLSSLPEADRALERAYLLGSAAASGLAERAFAFEIEHDVGLVERLLEYPLEGEFELAAADGPRRVRIRGKADRIDLLEDGTLRVIDYKLGRAPRSARALQLPIYGVCACQHLEGHHGRSWTLGRAGYVAFREKNAFVALGGSASLAEAVADGQERFLQAVDAIERGDFPVDPAEPFLCTRCGYAGVCRKDYVGDE